MESSLAAAQRRPSTFEQGAILADIVPHDVLDLMIQRVRKCWDYYKEVLEAEEDFLPAQVDNATRAFERCICRELKRIMRLNKSLPPGDLERWWKAYCAA